MKLTFKNGLAAVALTLASGVVMAAEHVVEMKNSGADGTMVFEPGFVKAEPGDPVNYDAAKAAVDKLTAAAATNKDRLKGYFEQVQ
jgi:plastocyanin